MGSVVALDLFRVSKVIGVKWSTGLHESAVNSSGSIGVSNLDDNVACAFCPVSRIVLWGQGGCITMTRHVTFVCTFNLLWCSEKGWGGKKLYIQRIVFAWAGREDYSQRLIMLAVFIC